MSRSSWAASMGLALMVILVLASFTVPVPFVAIGRGPTYNTLGELDAKPVVAVKDLPTFPTSGHLNMTTVSVTDGLSVVDALERWISPDYQVEPRSIVFPPDESRDEVAERNKQDFADSQASAEGAAFIQLGLPTVVVVEQLVGQAGAPSPSAGVLEPGDVLLDVAGHPVTTPTQLAGTLASTRPGQQLPLRYQRNGGPPTPATVTLGSRPDGPQGALGIAPGARPADRNEVTISLGDVGGPSAGLMFALAIVDKLTPGELNGGRFVAGTGTITSTGLVGPIEGIRYKMAAAREAGATTFLVPRDNCAVAVATAPPGLRLVKAESLAGAVDSLKQLDAGGDPPGC